MGDKERREKIRKCVRKAEAEKGNKRGRGSDKEGRNQRHRQTD